MNKMTGVVYNALETYVVLNCYGCGNDLIIKWPSWELCWIDEITCCCWKKFQISVDVDASFVEYVLKYDTAILKTDEGLSVEEL